MFSVYLSEEIIVVNMEPEPGFKKMDTVVKLDCVSFIFMLFYVTFIERIRHSLNNNSALRMWLK